MDETQASTRRSIHVAAAARTRRSIELRGIFSGLEKNNKLRDDVSITCVD
jgi:hypothetical protein